ncbi:hypothetical protein Mgra_00000042, partial [Meloidogyne graminicola]
MIIFLLLFYFLTLIPLAVISSHVFDKEIIINKSKSSSLFLNQEKQQNNKKEYLNKYCNYCNKCKNKLNNNIKYCFINYKVNSTLFKNEYCILNKYELNKLLNNNNKLINYLNLKSKEE